MSLSNTIEYYLTFSYTLTDRTRVIYREHLTRLCQHLNDPPVGDIQAYHLAEFMGSLRKVNGKPYSAGYLDQVYRSLKTFFLFCREEDLIRTNPLRKVKRPKITTGPRPTLTLDQVDRLVHQAGLTALADRNKAVVCLMVDSGLRLNEVVNLRACDVRLEDGLLYALSAKTHARHKVPMGPRTKDAVAAYLAARPPFNKTDDPFFLTREGEPLTKESIHLLLKRLQKHLKFPLHAHLLRHTFANIYNRKGNLRKLQKILGHSRLETTAIYVNPNFREIQEEHEQVSPLAQLAALGK